MVNSITVEGFTAKQRILADLVWNMDSANQVEKFVRNLPENDAQDARIVVAMITAAALDQVKETDLAEQILVDIMRK
jgi:hypothetical protein